MFVMVSPAACQHLNARPDEDGKARTGSRARMRFRSKPNSPEDLSPTCAAHPAPVDSWTSGQDKLASLVDLYGCTLLYSGQTSFSAISDDQSLITHHSRLHLQFWAFVRKSILSGNHRHPQCIYLSHHFVHRIMDSYIHRSTLLQDIWIGTIT